MHFITILGLGFLLGARHALDADHLVAVSTILCRYPDPRAPGLIGFCWGFGHTVVLLMVGCAVMALNVTIPEPLALALEFGVGVLLVVLGASLAYTIFRERWHLHAHQHGAEMHLHLHSHRFQPQHAHGHWIQYSLQPALVGMVHGLAGSAALMLMVLSTVRTLWEGAAYILMFGLGSILGMMVLGVLISLPLLLTASVGRRAHLAVQGLASIGSIGFGLAMMLTIGHEAHLF
ncbi:MAG: urease accessory protein UreH [Nitrospiraceae bacterium]